MTTTTEALRARLRAESEMHAKRGDEHLSALLDEVALALSPSSAPAADIDEAQLARMTERGAVAWAGVDPQALREGGQPSAPAERIAAALALPACTRLREWAAIGPVQRAAVDSFADAVQPSAPSAEPAAIVYPPDGTVSPFTIINLGAGRVQIGDGIHDGRLPALWFGKNGQGMGREEVMNRHAHEGETLAVVTFANVEGLDVLADVIQRIRRVSFPGTAPQQTAPQAAFRCQNCDDTGDVHSITGEWRGVCHCPAGQEMRATPQAGTVGAPELLKARWEGIQSVQAQTAEIVRAAIELLDAAGDNFPPETLAAFKRVFGDKAPPAAPVPTVQPLTDARIADAQQDPYCWCWSHAGLGATFRRDRYARVVESACAAAWGITLAATPAPAPEAP